MYRMEESFAGSQYFALSLDTQNQANPQPKQDLQNSVLFDLIHACLLSSHNLLLDKFILSHLLSFRADPTMCTTRHTLHACHCPKTTTHLDCPNFALILLMIRGRIPFSDPLYQISRSQCVDTEEEVVSEERCEECVREEERVREEEEERQRKGWEKEERRREREEKKREREEERKTKEEEKGEGSLAKLTRRRGRKRKG
jgi:flagellar biosynthesis GTPase FlhF